MSDMAPTVIWEPTMNLRQKMLSPAQTPYILQQLWVDKRTGKGEWRRVEFVPMDEPDEWSYGQ